MSHNAFYQALLREMQQQHGDIELPEAPTQTEEPTPMSKLRFNPDDYPFFKTYRDSYLEEAEALERRAENIRADRAAFTMLLQKEAQNYMYFGVAYVSQTLKSEFSYRSVKESPQTFFKSIAQKLERPLVYLEAETGHYSYTMGAYVKAFTLRVARSTRLENLIAGFLLMVDNQPQDSDGLVPITYVSHPRSWVFKFVGPTGTKVLQDWLNKCGEDKLYRLCLGVQNLPPVETPNLSG